MKIEYERRKSTTIIICISAALTIIFITGVIVVFVLIKKTFSISWNTVLNISLSQGITIFAVLSFIIFLFKLTHTFVKKLYFQFKFRNTDNSLQDTKINELKQLIWESDNIIYLHGEIFTGKSHTILSLIKNEHKYFQNKDITFFHCYGQTADFIKFMDDMKKLNNNSLPEDEDTKTIIIIDNFESVRYDIFLKYNFTATNKIFLIENSIEGEKRNPTNFIVNSNVEASKVNFVTEVKSKNLSSYKKRRILNLSKSEKAAYAMLLIVFKNYEYYNIGKFKKLVTESGLCNKTDLKKVLKLKLISPFFLNKNFYRLDFKSFVYAENLLNYDKDHEVLNYIISITSDKDIDEITKWSACVFTEIEFQNIREKLFDAALKMSNFVRMYGILEQVPNKSQVVLYEQSLIYYYMSMQSKSVDSITEFKKKTDIPNKKMDFKYIDCVHGSSDESVMKIVFNYLDEYENHNDIYRYHALYWKIHIGTERGVFLTSQFKKIINEIQEQYDTSDFEHTELIKRCYTDIFRSGFILNNKIDNEEADEFIKFLEKNYNDRNALVYYNKLYIIAGNTHYVEIPNLYLQNKSCKKVLSKASDAYTAAINSNYTSPKSNLVAELKSYDLKLIEELCVKSEINENTYSILNDFKLKVDNFREISLSNNVDVHVAYCDTLLFKILLIKNILNNINNDYRMEDAGKKIIESYLKSAKDIYHEYKNEYGVKRCLVLEIFMNKYYSPNKSIENNNDKFDDRDKKFIGELNNIKSPRDFIQICKLISVYPIVLQ